MHSMAALVIYTKRRIVASHSFPFAHTIRLIKPTRVDHIIYYARGDGNAVETGDE